MRPSHIFLLLPVLPKYLTYIIHPHSEQQLYTINILLQDLKLYPFFKLISSFVFYLLNAFKTYSEKLTTYTGVLGFKLTTIGKGPFNQSFIVLSSQIFLNTVHYIGLRKRTVMFETMLKIMFEVCLLT